jgi:hypothetical protein
MFNVRVSKTIWADEERTTIADLLYRDFELPFPPYVGLVITHDSWNSGVIREVWWQNCLQQFSVTVVDDTPNSPNNFNHLGERLDERHLKTGWKSNKYRPRAVT